MPDKLEPPTSVKPGPVKPSAVPVEDRYGAVPVDLLAVDRGELLAGDRDAQLAAHGKAGDAIIADDGGDAVGLEEAEIPAAEEVLTTRAEKDVALSYRAPEYEDHDIDAPTTEEELRKRGVHTRR